MQVAALGRDNQVIFDYVYAFGHKDSNAVATFVTFEVQAQPASSRPYTYTMSMTGGHFIQTTSGHILDSNCLLSIIFSSWQSVVFRLALIMILHPAIVHLLTDCIMTIQ